MTLLIPDIRAQIFKLNRFQGISSTAYVACAGIFKQFMGGKESSRKRVVVPARQATQPGGIGSLESIIGLLKCLNIRDGTTTLFLLGS